jgi:SAM-dependent methyltransferase
MRAVEADFRDRNDPHGYVLQGAPWLSGERPFHALCTLGLTEDSDVLDYGCGSLRVGRFLIMALGVGHYFGIEPSEWAVKEGLKEIGTLGKVKGARFQHPDYGTFDASLFGEQRFDFVLCSGVLTHMDDTQIRSTLGSAASVLKPGGRIVGSYLPSGPHHDGTGWLYPQQAPHYALCISAALAGTGLTMRDIDVPGDPAQWFDTWFEASR